MSENQNEIQAARQARIDKNKDKNNLIADNGLKDHVYDIYDILATSRDPEVLKVKNLMQAGVTEEYIVDVYTGLSGNVVSMEEALSALNATFFCIATEITNNPNGIVIDMATGLIDERKSAIQAKKVGLEVDGITPGFIKEQMKKFESQNPVKELLESFKELTVKETVVNNLEMIKNRDWYRVYENPNDYLKNVPKEYLDFVDKNVKILKKYNSTEAEYIRLVHDMKHAEGTVLYDELVAKEVQMLKENPELAEMKLKDEMGNLDPRVDEFMDAEKNAMIGIILNNFSNNDINEIRDEQMKKFITIFSLAAMKIPQYKDDALKVLGLTGKSLEEQLAFYNKVLGTKMDNEEKLQKKIDLFSEAIEHAADIGSMFEVVQKGKIQDYMIDDLMESMGKDLTITSIEKQLKENKKTNIEKQFNGSVIKFDKDDLDKINESYKEGTINSWISSKQEAKEYKVLMLVLQKEELGYLSSKAKIHENNIKAIDNRIKETIEQYPELADLFDENGEMKPESREKAELFQTEKLKSEIMKLYVKDLNDDKDYSRENFDNMSRVAKKEYIRTTIAGLEFADKTGNIALKKLALRRLEVLNDGQDSENWIIDVDANCNYMIHNDNLLHLYGDTKDLPGISNFGDLKTKMAAQMISQKIVKKMDEIIDMPDENLLDFSDLSPEDKIKAIENSKTEGKRRRIESGKEKPYNYPGRDEEEIEENERHELAATEKRSEQDQVPAEESINNESQPVNTESPKEETNNIKGGFFNNIKEMFNRLMKRNQLRITDGKENQEKKGFFSRLFNRKEDVTIIPINLNEDVRQSEDMTKKKSSFDESIRYGERDGSLEKNAIDGMKKQDNVGKSIDGQEQDLNG